jgi:CPA2 family monovalent cation:H+ antiporter-2
MQFADIPTALNSLLLFGRGVPDLVILLAFAVGIVALFRLLRLNPVLGYLVAGAIIGPNGLSLISDPHRTEIIAEFGIVFLMFMIGLDLSWDRLKAMRSQVLGIGSAPILFTTATIGLLAFLCGQSVITSLVIGTALALSSTALVLQVLEQRNELAGQSGRLSLAILILQDLAVLPLLVLLPLLATGEGSVGGALGLAMLKALAALMVIVMVGRLALRPLFRLIARLDIGELFVATTLLVVLGVSWATEQAGLSAALGAFLAGLLLAETEFRHQIEADVKPYKSLLMGLFFMTVGMIIDAVFILEHLTEVLVIAIGLIAIKSGVLFAILRVGGYGKRSSIHTALLLAQGGEFGFILFGLAGQFNVLEPLLVQKLLLAITLSMAATPLLDTLGAALERRWWHRVRTTPGLLAAETRDLDGHVVIAGYGRMGQLIGTYLSEEKIPYVALDTNPREVSNGRKRHQPVYYGDASRPDVLEAIGIDRAHALIVTSHEPNKTDALVRAMRASYPNMPIFARARDMAHVRALELMGANLAVPELQVSSMRMLSGLLSALGRPEEEVQRVMELMRE